jgi:hypothetical protein
VGKPTGFLEVLLPARQRGNTATGCTHLDFIVLHDKIMNQLPFNPFSFPLLSLLLYSFSLLPSSFLYFSVLIHL